MMKAFSTIMGALFQIFLAYVLDYGNRYLQYMASWSINKELFNVGQFAIMLVFVLSMLWLTKYVVVDKADNLGLQFTLSLVGGAILLGSLLHHLGRTFWSYSSPLAGVFGIAPNSYAAIACMLAVVVGLYSLFSSNEVG